MMGKARLRMKSALAGVAAAWLAWTGFAAEMSGRKVAWAHYVGWNPPQNVSLAAWDNYDTPVHDAGADPLKAEVSRALEMGIDGFLVDVCVVGEKGDSAFWDLRPHLKAAEGTPFQFGICIDANPKLDRLASEIIRMLRVYGGHPNYPRMNGRPVVGTYAFKGRDPKEWVEVKRRCADAGIPIYLIGNVETFFSPFVPEDVARAADAFDCAYHFACMAMHPSQGLSVEDVSRQSAAVCAERGRKFMPCLWPGYYGAWLARVNCYYQPFLGYDTLLRRQAIAMKLDADWLHLTTWNDHFETTLEPRRLTTGLRRMVTAMTGEFKGLPPPKEVDVQFAYLRETMPGTVHRFEAVRPPVAESPAVSVRGWLRDADGRVVADLAAKDFGAGRWERVEWLVNTTPLSASPLLTPEFEVRSPQGVRRAAMPPVFLFLPYMRNPETVRVSILDRREIANELSVSFTNGVLSATCSVDSPAALRRATLYRNERAVTSFGESGRTVLPLHFKGEGLVRLAVENGRIENALKSFETNGAPHFRWGASELVSTLTPGWMKFAARIVCSNDATAIAFSSAGETRKVSAAELVARGRIDVKKGWLSAESPDCTLRDEPPLDVRSGTLRLAAAARPPEPTDAFWTEFEFADGTFASSRVVYPFAKDAAPVKMNVVETPVTLDWTSGACGQPGAKAFLSDERDWPVSATRVVETPVSPLSVRRHRFPMAADGRNVRPRAELPFREWPMGAFTLKCSLRPLTADGKAHPLLVKGGWQDGPEMWLAADGRLGASYSAGGTKRMVHSRRPLAVGRTVRVELASDCRELRLAVDGAEQTACDIPPRRSYGNCQPQLGEGVNGPNPTVAELFGLEY